MYTSIIVTGSMAYDDIMDFPSRFVDVLHPEELHQINVSFVVDKLEKQMGGTGSNIAYSLALLHLSTPIRLLSSVGRDGAPLVEYMQTNGVDTSRIINDPSVYTATGKVITDVNNNQIWGFYYGACERAKDISLEPYLQEKPFVIVSANHPQAFIHFEKEAIEHHFDFMFDPGMGLSWITNEDLEIGIKHCLYLVGNDYEISLIEKKLGKKIRDLLSPNAALITTLGKEGVNYQSKTEEHHMNAYCAKLLDPTGAGDAFRSGFVGGLIQGLPTADCLILGNVMASFAVEYYGTINHHPSREEIEKRCELL